MNVVIVGCGRVGALLAGTLDAQGHEVAIVDTSTVAFDRLPSTFRGNAIRGDGTDEDTLRRAGTGGADLFLALTQGDNRNVMAAQLASEVFGVRQSIATIHDTVRAQAYADLGIATVCRTELVSDAVLSYLGMPTLGAPGVRPPTGGHDSPGHRGIEGRGAGEEAAPSARWEA